MSDNNIYGDLIEKKDAEENIFEEKSKSNEYLKPNENSVPIENIDIVENKDINENNKISNNESISLVDMNDIQLPKWLEAFGVSSLFVLFTCFILNLLYFFIKSNVLIGFNYYPGYQNSISNLDPMIMHKQTLIFIIYFLYLVLFLATLILFYFKEKKKFLSVYQYKEMLNLGISHYLLSIVIVILTFTDNSTIINMISFIILFFANIINFSNHIKIRKNYYNRYFLAFIIRGYYPAFLTVNSYLTFSNLLKAIMISSYESANIAGSVIFAFLFLYSTSVMKDSHFSLLSSVVMMGLIIFSSVNYSITKYSYKDLISYCAMFFFLILALIMNIFKIGLLSFGFKEENYDNINEKTENLINKIGTNCNNSNVKIITNVED